MSISGRISPTAGGAGVTVHLGGASSATTTTDSAGNYVFDGLASGVYTVTPSKTQIKFTPSSQNAVLGSDALSGVNFTVVSNIPAQMFVLSGTITGGSGATVVLSGPVTATTTADSAGNFHFDNISKGFYTLTPSKSQMTFTPASRSANVVSANVDGINFSGSPIQALSFTIAGAISPAANGGGVTVALSGEESRQTTTDASGRYSFSGLEAGSYTVTPTKSNVNFSPARQNATVTTANVVGLNFGASPVQALTYTISGVVTPVANGTGVTVALSGGQSETTRTDSSGRYSFSGLNAGSYTVTPSKSSFNFSPAHESAVVGTSNVAGINFTASPAISSTGTVNIYPGQDITAAVNAAPAGTTFVIAPGIYRLSRPIVPKTGDSFIGQASCAPPATPCAAVISGATLIGPQATFDGTNYRVTGQTQQGARSPSPVCDPGWPGCVFPEDLFFDNVPYQHLSSAALPAVGPHQWWFDYRNHVIYFHDNPSGHIVETSVVNNAFGGSANHVTIQYLTVEKVANMYPTSAIGDYPNGNPQSAAASWTVQNCEVRLNHGAGIRVNYGTQILSNYIHDNGQLGIGGGIGNPSVPGTESMNSGVLVQGNTINHNDFAHFNPGFGSGGFKVGATSGITLRGNTIQNNEGSGIHFDVNSQNEFVDGNIITDNTDSDGLAQEIGYGTSVFRNNIVLRNGAQVNGNGYTYQIAVRASSGVNAYCNVMEISKGKGINGWGVGASNRGTSIYPPYQYLASTGNAFHHNTVIWDTGATGIVGFIQNDATNQPNFFANNSRPDFSTYYLSSSAAPRFVYDDNDTQKNLPVTFASYQAGRADIHGAVDTNYSGGYPSVSITSPLDQSSVGQVTVSATASDATGISKVEFYVDWALQSTATSTPYNFNWANGTSGPHTVAAVAYSNAGIQACYAVTLNHQ